MSSATLPYTFFDMMSTMPSRSSRRIATAPTHAQVNRQDLAGFSFIGMGSNYALAGAPGWVNASSPAPLAPHPDWYTTVRHAREMDTGICR